MEELKVIYEDNHIIVVEKPVNIPSQGDKTGDIDMLTIIKGYIKEKYNKPGNVYLGLVHRLDRPVGGVMVFAKTSKAARRLNEQIVKKDFSKKYSLRYSVSYSEVERVVGYDTPMFPIPYKRYKIEYNDGSEKTIGYKVLGLIFITDEIWVQ